MVRKKDNGAIDIDAETQKDLAGLCRARNEISMRIELILRTYLNAHGKKGNYKTNEALTRLEPVIGKKENG